MIKNIPLDIKSKILNKYNFINNNNNFNNDLNEYIKDLVKRRRKYKFFLYINNTLRLLQTLSTFSISILTTTNNPYIYKYEEDINLYLWYIAIFSTFINLSLESLNKYYNLTNNKITNDLLKCEHVKLIEKKIPYDDIYYPNDYNKISCFLTSVKLLRTDNPSQPIKNVIKLYKRSSTPYDENTNIINGLAYITKSNIKKFIINNNKYIHNILDKEHNENNDEKESNTNQYNTDEYKEQKCIETN